MSDAFFARPVINSPYECPTRHWELEHGQPTQRVIESRRRAEFVTPIPKPKKRRGRAAQADGQADLELDAADARDGQAYEHMSLINEVRSLVSRWREAADRSQWGVTPETARLLAHWRHHDFAGPRPFFCQVEAAETAIWLTEVAPHIDRRGGGRDAGIRGRADPSVAVSQVHLSLKQRGACDDARGKNHA
jgi:type III restriction enzyme